MRLVIAALLGLVTCQAHAEDVPRTATGMPCPVYGCDSNQMPRYAYHADWLPTRWKEKPTYITRDVYNARYRLTNRT